MQLCKGIREKGAVDSVRVTEHTYMMRIPAEFPTPINTSYSYKYRHFNTSLVYINYVATSLHDMSLVLVSILQSNRSMEELRGP
jgi:hypothetical protein